jgi:hypothetical protein
VLVAPSSRPPAGGVAGFLLLALAIAFPPVEARAHDPSRTRSGDGTWFIANPVGFLSGAIALAINPVDSNHLHPTTDSGLLCS